MRIYIENIESTQWFTEEEQKNEWWRHQVFQCINIRTNVKFFDFNRIEYIPRGSFVAHYSVCEFETIFWMSEHSTKVDYWTKENVCFIVLLIDWEKPGPKVAIRLKCRRDTTFLVIKLNVSTDNLNSRKHIQRANFLLVGIIIHTIKAVNCNG